MGIQCSHCGFIVVGNRTTHNCDIIIKRRENKEMLITAKEAKELSGPSIEEHIERLSNWIRDAALKKQQSIIVRAQPYERWLYSGWPKSDTVEGRVLLQLKNAGYTVEFHYKEMQFVDMGLKISWE